MQAALQHEEAQAKAQRDREAREEAERQFHIAQKKWDGVFPQWRQSARAPLQTFDTVRLHPGNQLALSRIRAWVDTWPREGFVLTGPVGTGKTHMVRCVVHEALKAQKHVLYTSVPYLLERLRDQSRNGPTMEQVLDLHIQASVVVWDDLGAERPTDWTLDRLFLLVDARYEANRPLLATTNWSLKQLEERVGARIVSRLLEMNPVWALSGSDERVQLAKKRMEKEA